MLDNVGGDRPVEVAVRNGGEQDVVVDLAQGPHGGGGPLNCGDLIPAINC